MTPKEREEMTRLCEIIQTEQNHAKFMEAIQQLIQLLRAKQRRIDPTAQERAQLKFKLTLPILGWQDYAKGALSGMVRLFT
jgi:hypothetical protein